MKQQKWNQILLSFSGVTCLILVVTQGYYYLNQTPEWEQFLQHVRSLLSLGQAVNTLEYKNFMSFLGTVQDRMTFVSSGLLPFFIFLNLAVGISCGFLLFGNLKKERPYVEERSDQEADNCATLVCLEKNGKTPVPEEQQTFARALDEVKGATEALAKIVGKGTLAEIQGDLDRHEIQYNKIIQVAASGNLICNEIQGVHKAILNTSKRLQRLAHQCRDSANFSATTQLDWKRNIMINNLRQVKESQDKVHDTANHIRSIHQSSKRLLQEIFGVEVVFQERCRTTSVYLNQVQDASKPGFREINTMVTSIGDAKDQAGQAVNLVSGLTQRAEAIVNMIHVIDDLAEQINLQALNASIEAAKMGQQGFKFAEIAEKLCKLTSRSSVTSHSISELLTTIQEETGRAGGQLNSACESIESAFTQVGECGHTYRKAVSSTKYAMTELSLLGSEFSIHMNKLREVEKLGDTTSEFFERLSSLLDADDKMSNRMSDETSKLTAHSDRLSQLLARQFHELNHCEKMLLDTMNLVQELEKQATENKHATMSLKVALEQLNSVDGAISLDDFSQRIANRHLTALKSSTETLEHFRLPKHVNIT